MSKQTQIKSNAKDKGVKAPSARPLPKRPQNHSTDVPQKTLKQAAKWLAMMCDPYGAEIVRSPAGTSQLASKAKIVKKFSLTQAQAGPNGQFGFVARPSLIDPVLVSAATSRFPLVGELALLLAQPLGVIDKDSNSVQGGMIASASGYTETPIISSTQITGYNAYNIATIVANDMTYSIENQSSVPFYIQAKRYNVAPVWSNIGGVTLVPPKSNRIVTANTAATTTNYIAFVHVDASGAEVPAEHHIKVSITMTMSSAYIPQAAGGYSLTRLVKDDLIDAASVTNARVTAMSMLVSNMAPATHDGGLLVSGCVEQSLLYEQHNVQDCVNAIMALPETNRWQRSIIHDGGYAYWVPNDLQSYEPHHPSSYDVDDNCVCAFGFMSEGGSIDVIVTFIVEWYTPVQLFERSPGPSWTPPYEVAFRTLLMSRMASHNEDHESMIKNIQARAQKALKWAWDNRYALHEILMAVHALL